MPGETVGNGPETEFSRRVKGAAEVANDAAERAASTAQRLQGQARRVYGQAEQAAEQASEQISERIREAPLTATLISLGIGFLLGAAFMAGVASAREPESASLMRSARRLRDDVVDRLPRRAW